MKYIITAQAGAIRFALAEAGRPKVLKSIEEGVALCEDASVQRSPIFLRHICPAQAEATLHGTMEDIALLCDGLVPLLPMIQQTGSFSVQTRIAETYQPPYKRFDINTALCKLIENTGASLDVKCPKQIISVMLMAGIGWIGISHVEENLHDWAGGARRFKWEEGQISRAEFKLLEAMELFQMKLDDGTHVLDLGAAPGGWTRILRRHGVYVTAVDPAVLDARLVKDRRITHVRTTAQVYFETQASQNLQFDVLVNDMKMDSAESATLMLTGAACLKAGGEALLTLKLPENTNEWLIRIEEAKAILEKAYIICGMKQLFHNRNEVTVYMRKL